MDWESLCVAVPEKSFTWVIDAWSDTATLPDRNKDQRPSLLNQGAKVAINERNN
jgi:hypothetical protein